MDLENRAIEVLKKYRVIDITKNLLKFKDRINNKPFSKEIEDLKRYITYTNNIFLNELNDEIDPLLITIKNKIHKKKYEGVVIYPLAVKWEPVQRPHHILRKLGEQGYLCFFCEENDNTEFTIEEKYKNVYLVNKQEKLLPLVKNVKTIVLITYFLQYLYAKYIPNKVLWLDILDKLDFLSSYNDFSKKIWDEAINNSLIVSYSAANLKQYLINRDDAVLIENAVNIEDFQNKNQIIPKDIKTIINDNKKIIGYYGAVEEWFDFELLKKIDEKYNIIIIGKVNSQLNIKKYNFNNTYFLGPKQFEELKQYAQYFDVAIIPFKVNEMTNCVSPVKFFEYMALNKPVISTNISEMKNYKSDVVKIVNQDNVIQNIEELLSLKKEKIIQECNKIASKNTWEKRVEKVIDLF